MPIDLIGFAYAATVAAGGMMGYAKAGSIPSLGAGILFGSVLTYGAFQASQNPPSYAIQLATSGLLGGMMGYRYYNSGKIMPAGVVCLLSVAMVIRIGMKAAGFLSSPEAVKAA